jgi:hypothetical protein
MNRMLIGAALAAVSGAALAQDLPATDWAYFEPEDGPLQAGVVAADGSQLILKCDKPGKRSVYAVVATNTSLAPPMSDDRYESHTVTLRMDENAPWNDNWRFNDRFAMAVDKGNTRALTRLLEKLRTADKVELRFKPNNGLQTIVNFGTAGAQDAIARVYAGCKDEVPYG